MGEHAVSSRATLGILGTRAGIYPIKFVVTLIVAPLLGTTDYGIYSFLVLPGTVLLPLVLFGLSPAIRFYVSKGDWSAQEVGFPALVIGLAHGLFAAAVTYGLWNMGWLGKTGTAVSFEMLAPVLYILPLQGASLTMNVVMTGASWFSAMNLYMMLNNVLPPIALTALVIFGGLGLEGAIWTIVVANGMLGIWAIGAVYTRYRPQWAIHLRMLSQFYRYGMKASVGAFANRTSVRLDQFVLGFARAPEDLGVYRIAVMVAELLWIIPDAVSIPLFNRLSGTADEKESVAIISRSHRVVLLVVVAAAVGLFLAGWLLLPLVLGAEYASAWWLLGLLIPGTVSLVTSRLINMFFSSSGRPEVASLVEVIGAVVSVIAYVVLIPPLGVVGAAIGTSIAYIIIAFASNRIFRQRIAPLTARMFRVRRDDITWAIGLVRDSFKIWGARLKND